MSEDTTTTVPVQSVDPEIRLVAPAIGTDAAEFPAAERYAGAGLHPVAKATAEALGAPFADDAYDILPTGEVYVGQVHYRRRLNETFYPGGWALVPQGPISIEGGTLYREYHLVGPGGRFLAEAIGECAYQENNERMSYGDAVEGAKSNALSRCCKDLSIASECWDRRWAEAWKGKHCVKVWRSSQKKPQWRRADAPPWHDETGLAQTAESTSVSAAVFTPAKDPQFRPAESPKAQSATSTREAGPECPNCGQRESVMRSRYGPGYFCNPKSWGKPGCGAKFGEDPGGHE